ncbi:MAG: hypothetical protein ABFC94_17510 [Syntrophomonas sp.]
MPDGESIEKGRIKLASKTRPPLQGEYTITVSQELGDNPKLAQSKIKAAHFSFTCEAEPLKLSSDEVYSVYPPKDSFGKFEHILPHIVLRRRTLPWERVFGDREGVPWMTLLLFDEQEGTELKSLTQREAFTPEPGVYCPVKAIAPDEPCTVLDVPSALFCDVCPAWEELPLMAHSRCVSRDDKVTEADVVDEWLAVLVANRTPCSDTSDTGVKNTAFLVSVEAFVDFFTAPSLRQKISQELEYKKVRIPVLSCWDFYSKQENYDFKSVFENLDTGVLKTPLPSNASEEVEKLLARGFVPLNHSLRDGGRTVSWYHGPLSPYKPTDTEKDLQLFSDARLIYEPEMGMFEISYSAAFNLGRLLALRSGPFSAALDSWRQSNKREAALRENRKMISSRFKKVDSINSADRLGDMEQTQLESLMEDAVAALVTALRNGGADDGEKLGGRQE